MTSLDPGLGFPRWKIWQFFFSFGYDSCGHRFKQQQQRQGRQTYRIPFTGEYIRKPGEHFLNISQFFRQPVFSICCIAAGKAAWCCQSRCRCKAVLCFRKRDAPLALDFNNNILLSDTNLEIESVFARYFLRQPTRAWGAQCLNSLHYQCICSGM